MPKGPQGQECPVNVISNTIWLTIIATNGEEGLGIKQPAKNKSGLVGLKACSKALNECERNEVAKDAARTHRRLLWTL